MIVWQLMNVLSKKRELIEQLKCYSTKEFLEENIVIDFLSQSDEVFSICSDGNLRSSKENYAFDIGVLEELNAVETYKKFGGKALSEVLDYGSWPIPQDFI